MRRITGGKQYSLSLSLSLPRIALGILPAEEERMSVAVFAVKHGAFCGARLPGNVKHSKRQRERFLPFSLSFAIASLQSSRLSPLRLERHG